MSALSTQTVYETSIRTMSREEKRHLIDTIEQELAVSDQEPPRMTWEQIKQLGPYHYWHEDPQDWISRTRREADERRAEALRWDQ